MLKWLTIVTDLTVSDTIFKKYNELQKLNLCTIMNNDLRGEAMSQIETVLLELFG